MEKIYKVQMDGNGMPDYSTADEVQTKSIKYFDEDESVWKIGDILVDRERNQQIELPWYAEWEEAYKKMMDCQWK